MLKILDAEATFLDVQKLIKKPEITTAAELLNALKKMVKEKDGVTLNELKMLAQTILDSELEHSEVTHNTDTYLNRIRLLREGLTEL